MDGESRWCECFFFPLVMLFYSFFIIFDRFFLSHFLGWMVKVGVASDFFGVFLSEVNIVIHFFHSLQQVRVLLSRSYLLSALYACNSRSIATIHTAGDDDA
jgi:hypothetical protein